MGRDCAHRSRELVGNEHFKIHSAAAFALAKIGVSTPDVLDAFERAYQLAGEELNYGHLGIIGALSVLGDDGKDRAESLAQGSEVWVIGGVGNLNDEALRHLPALPLLQDIHLSGRTLTDAGMTHLSRFQSLRTLNLRDDSENPSIVAELQDRRTRLSPHRLSFHGHVSMSVGSTPLVHNRSAGCADADAPMNRPLPLRLAGISSGRCNRIHVEATSLWSLKASIAPLTSLHAVKEAYYRCFVNRFCKAILRKRKLIPSGFSGLSSHQANRGNSSNAF